MPVAKARAYIRAFLRPVTTVERLHVRAALGRVLAEDITSVIDVPGHDNSAMDGYAMRFADLRADAESALRVVGASFAGKPYEGTLGSGEAVRIMTGGVMPDGADTVVMQERVSAVGGRGQDSRRAAEGAERARGRLRHRARPGRVQARPDVAPGRARHDRLARDRRGVRVSAAARRLLLHRRRAGAGRPAARCRADLRQQPLHHPRHAHAAGSRQHRHGRDPRRSCRHRAGVRRGGARRRRGHHQRRRIGGRGGLSSSRCSTGSARSCSGRSR